MRLIVVSLVALFLLTGCGSSSPSAGSGGDEIFVMLSEENGSGESGTAKLTPLGKRTKIELELETPVAPRQPAQIHRGSCDLSGQVAYGLADLRAGRSATIVEARLSALRNASFAIDVGESRGKSAACGEIGTGRTMNYDPLGHDRDDD